MTTNNLASDEAAMRDESSTVRPPSHQLYLDCKTALTLAEAAELTGRTDHQLLRMGQSTLSGAPSPKMRFCLTVPEGFQVFKVTPTFLCQILDRTIDSDDSSKTHSSPTPLPELFENFDYLVLEANDCKTLCNRGSVDVSIFRHGIAFDGLDIPRPLPFEDVSCIYHRILALSKPSTNHTGHYTARTFALSPTRVKSDDLYILVSDLSLLIDLTGKTEQNANLQNDPEEATISRAVANEDIGLSPITARNDDPQNADTEEETTSIAKAREDIGPFVESELHNDASNDLKLVLEAAKKAWGKSYYGKDNYPTNKEVAKTIQETFSANHLPPPAHKPAFHLASLIRPEITTHKPDDSYEMERNSRFINRNLHSCFLVFSAISETTAKGEKPEENQVEKLLRDKSGMCDHLLVVGTKVILNKFSSSPAKEPHSDRKIPQKKSTAKPNDPFSKMTDSSYSK